MLSKVEKVLVLVYCYEEHEQLTEEVIVDSWVGYEWFILKRTAL